MSNMAQEGVRQALAGLAHGALREGAVALFDALGYQSGRVVNVGSVTEFLELQDAENKLNDRQHELLSAWQAVEFVFQITEKEIRSKKQEQLFPGADWEPGRIESFVFLAAELADGVYSRTQLAEATRGVNKLFLMPVVVLFRYGDQATLAVVHRRPHKRDEHRDVLEKVTLVKDIHLRDLHRAHLDILSELELKKLIADAQVRSFDDLHCAWENALDAEELNRRFYPKLFEWFKRAVKTCSFPDDSAGEGSGERHVIRLITRLLFIWFLKEKRLVPEELFKEDYAVNALKNHGPDSTDYYRAVLQNLFFATLNTEIGKRSFSKQARATHRDFSRYRYRALLRTPNGFLAKLKIVPFVNGGLFDCLDDFESVSEGGKRIDAFTDNIGTHGKDLKVPARVFLDETNGLFTLFRRFKFTVEENTPLDREVALDPELLGHVFENLLAACNPETRETARRATGSYYTPRHIVDYMVNEALVEALVIRTQPTDGDAEYWRDRIRYLLDYEDAFNDAGDLFESEEAEAVVRAIAGLRVLDPAAGSGAFPMSVLHKLTLALRRLDPENTYWERLQRELAGKRALVAFEGNKRPARDAELLNISEIFETYRDSDYGRKLYLIQNSIFGVDIQPIACQIAKLRVFISLVVEQRANDDPASNYGIRPLPNLETRFVAADVLIGIGEERQMALGESQVQHFMRRLANVHERHFSARSRDEKRKLRDEDAALRSELADTLESLHFGHGNARLVANCDLYNQNASAGWFDPRWMFGTADGFDVIIGNPPYIQLQKDRGKLGRHYKNAGFETFARTGDIYQLFYEKGCQLLSPQGGLLVFITSNSWLKAEYGKNTRRWLSENHSLLLLLEVGKDVFRNAIVDTCILVVRSGKSDSISKALDMDRLTSKEFPPNEKHWGKLRANGESPWAALSSIESGIMDKMESVGTPLKDWDISIYRGVLTGCNEAFIIDDNARRKILIQDPKSADLLKPILRGRDIRRYRPQWKGLWLIATFPSCNFDIDAYPAIKRHLLSYGKDRLEQTGITHPNGIRARKRTSHRWFELQDTCAYHAEFSGEKLFWPDMAKEGRFAYCKEESYCNSKGYIMTGISIKYLCAVLNSPAIKYFMQNTAATTGMGLTEWTVVSVKRLPVPLVNAVQQKPFIKLVDDIIQAKEDFPNGGLRYQQDQVNSRVYKLYGFTQKEIQAIEKS